MFNVPKKVSQRLSQEISKFQKILKKAKDRDINEADTVTIITDMLAEAFGFDKYTEITGEQAIRGTFCDLAVKLDGEVKFLIEVKAIGLTLKENHLRQAIGYGANQGIPWVVLTNGLEWEIHRIKFERPVSSDCVCSFNIESLNPKKGEDQETLFLLCREGLDKDAIETFHEHIQSVNKFVIAAILRQDALMSVLKRELKRVSNGSKVTEDEIKVILESEVLKREVLDGEEAKRAEALVKKAAGIVLKKRKPRKRKQTASTEPEDATT